MKNPRSNCNRAFAEGFERGFNAPWYFLAGAFNTPDYAQAGEEKMVTIKARIRTVADVKEKTSSRK